MTMNVQYQRPKQLPGLALRKESSRAGTMGFGTRVKTAKKKAVAEPEPATTTTCSHTHHQGKDVSWAWAQSISPGSRALSWEPRFFGGPFAKTYVPWQTEPLNIRNKTITFIFSLSFLHRMKKKEDITPLPRLLILNATSFQKKHRLPLKVPPYL